VRPCCDPIGGDGRVAPRSGRNNVENLQAQRICSARNAQGAGEIVCAGRLRRKAQGIAVSPPGFTTRQGRTGRLLRMDTGLARPRRDGFTRSCTDVGQVQHPQPQRKTSACLHGDLSKVWRGSAAKARRDVSDLPFVTQAINRQHRGRCAFAQPVAASRGNGSQTPLIAVGRG